MNASRPSGPPALARRLGLGDAVFLGVGSMIGAGIFAAFTPAAQAAGTGLLVGLLLAVVVAYCNATSSAQLAARYPTSGGTYFYGRERLGPWPGFIAGWGFVIGKTASCAAMALTVGAYAAPPGWERPVGVVVVIVLAAVNYRGITRTARLTRIVVCIVLLCLTVSLAAALSGPRAEPAMAVGDLLEAGWYGTLQAAGLLFFAFAGYARIATLGEEVRDPARTIPRAILLALAVAAALYAAVALVLLLTLGPDGMAGSATPLATAVEDGPWPWAGVVVRVAASLAALGALLALLTGVGRTSLAMAREADLPRWLSAVHPVHQVPHRAEVVLAAVVVLLVLSIDVRGAIGFSSFGVLVYYLVANVSAFSQPTEERRYPRGVQVVGTAACVVLVLTLPLSSLVAGVIVLAIGVLYRVVRLRVD